MKLPHITQYLSATEVEGIYKLANESPPVTPVPQESDWKQRAKIVGTGLLGMAGGTLAGFGAMELADRAMGGGGAASSKVGIPASFLNKIVPIATGGAALTYTLWKAREMERLRDALKQSPDHRPTTE